MHVLPLPFGLALALLPRREANKLRVPKVMALPYEKPLLNVREQVRSRSFDAGRFIL
jgi:hypothetical protein